MIIPAVHIPINNTSNFGFTAFFSMIKDGRLNVVTAIMNDKTVPSSAPLVSKASATGIVPKNISIHWNSYDRCQNNPKRIIST